MDIEIYHYFLKSFDQNYYVYGSPKEKWISMIGENGIILTAFKIDQKEYNDYLNEKDGYTRIK